MAQARKRNILMFAAPAAPSQIASKRVAIGQITPIYPTATWPPERSYHHPGRQLASAPMVCMEVKR
jgi:hypothetical protein